MKLYFAGCVLSPPLNLALFVAGAKKRLFTYWEISGEIGKNKAYQEGFIQILSEGSVFIDSGAYSAKTHSQTINIEDYCDFLRAIKGNIVCSANLDIIGDYNRTQRNYEYMLKHSFNFPILNVVHLGASKEQIKDAIDITISNYIGLGGLVGGKKNKIKEFLNRFWSIARDYSGLKVHAFGQTTFSVLCAYPFYSADSSGAIVGGGLGRILTFSPRTGMSSHSHKSQKHVSYQNFGCVDKEKTEHCKRRIRNIKETVKMEEYITRLWEKRGIVWDD